jgi:glycerol-1-phosphate dehydrogenase [NAD(P)+]
MDDLIGVFGREAAEEAIRETGVRDRSWKGRRVRLDKMISSWDNIRRAVREILPGDSRLEQLMIAAGTPTTPMDLGIPAEWVSNALRCSMNLRNRYTALNLADDLGILGNFIKDLTA